MKKKQDNKRETKVSKKQMEQDDQQRFSFQPI